MASAMCGLTPCRRATRLTSSPTAVRAERGVWCGVACFRFFFAFCLGCLFAGWDFLSTCRPARGVTTGTFTFSPAYQNDELVLWLIASSSAVQAWNRPAIRLAVSPLLTG